MNIIADVEVVGLEKLPQGNVILAANHLGRLDTAVLIYALERDDLIMAVAEKYKDHPIFGAIGRSVNAIWLNRFEADFAALREILARMQKGGLMVIAPEGTRKKVERFKTGFLQIARGAGVPVLLVGLDYATRTVRIGPVIEVGEDIEAERVRVEAHFARFSGRHPQ